GLVLVDDDRPVAERHEVDLVAAEARRTRGADRIPVPPASSAAESRNLELVHAQGSYDRRRSRVRMATNWIDLLDPTPEELDEQTPVALHETAHKLVAARPQHSTGPRPGMLPHGSSVVGVFVIPVVRHEEDLVFYQELDMVLTHDAILTVRKTPLDGREPYDIDRVREAVMPDDPPGLIAYKIVDDIAQR